jgi:tetratricopeptide (TPR) repeat protein
MSGVNQNMSLASVVLLSSVRLFFGILLAFEIGSHMDVQWLPETKSDSTSSGLLGLLIAFTFSGAASRFDHRRELVIEEANAIGTPNSCTSCHSDKSAHWAADKVRQWYGHDPKGYQNYAETLHAVRSGEADDAKARVLALLRDKNQPAIARATATTELGAWLSPELLPLLTEGLSDPDPLVRNAGLQVLESLPPEQRWTIAHERLRDPVRSLRALAAAALAGTPVESIPPGEQSDFSRAADDYLASLRLNADDPGAQVNLGNFHVARGELAEAEQAYREALHFDPDRTSAYGNLADLIRQIKGDNGAKILLHEGLARQPQAAVLHHSLGLLQVREKILRPHWSR